MTFFQSGGTYNYMFKGDLVGIKQGRWLELNDIFQEQFLESQGGFQEILKYLNTIFQIRDFAFNYKQDIEIVLGTGSHIIYWKFPTYSQHSTIAKDQAKQQESFKQISSQIR